METIITPSNDSEVAANSPATKPRRADIYETVTNRILSQLEAGRIPWRKTWATGLPKSLTTGREYRGINTLILGMTEHKSRYWVTYRQALRLGGHVRKGERATPVVYWKWRTNEDMRKLRDKTGKESFAPCIPFVSTVFNLDQVEQVERPQDDVPFLPNERIEIAEQIYSGMTDKPVIRHAIGYQPAYVPSLDEILMPHLEQFEGGAAYYAALFHELAHSTGHASRLNRFKDAEGGRREKYSFEELVAEFCATFLCGFAGIENPEADALHVGYIQGWMTALKNDFRLALRAASAAQRAADYIRGEAESADC